MQLRRIVLICAALFCTHCTKASFNGNPTPPHDNNHQDSIKLLSNPLTYATVAGISVNIPKSDILGAITVPSGDSLKSVSVKPPTQGQLTEEADHYTFQTATVGNVVLQYDAVDANSLSTSNTITIKVGPHGVATAAYYACGDDKLYELSVDNQAILHTVNTTYLGRPIKFNDLAINASGEMYAKDHDNSGIYKLDVQSGVATQVVATVPGANGYLEGLTFMPDGNLATVQIVDGTIISFNLRTLQSAIIKQTTYSMEGGDFKELRDGYAYWTVSNATSKLCKNYGTVDYQTLVRFDPMSGSATEVGCLNQPSIYGLGFAHGKVYGFTGSGNVVEINVNDASTTVLASPGFTFVGAASNPSLW